MNRPDRLVVVLGTATEVGKTWVTCQLAEHLRDSGTSVAARKPAQSFETSDLDEGGPTDAELLAAATGDDPYAVCRQERWYPVALAPPMAADRLGRPQIHMADLVQELDWPPEVELGLVEAAGGSRSPLAHDGDGIELARQTGADAVVLVADPGLGTIHAVRSATDALPEPRVVVLLNRYDGADDTHRANCAWLTDRDALDVTTSIPDLAARLLSP